jgi:hypothetical protein
MSSSSFLTFSLVAGIIFLFIAVIGQAKLGFAEINPGFFGRFLALIIGIFILGIAAFLGLFPVETLDLLRTYLQEQIQQNIG